MLGQSAPVGTCIAHRPHTARARTVRCKGLQELVMGAAVSLSIGGLVYNGLRGQPEVCDMCGGNGGTKCFACGGSGEVAGVGIKDIIEASETTVKDPLRRASSGPRECKACKGSGLILCRTCKGSGYKKRL